MCNKYLRAFGDPEMVWNLVASLVSKIYLILFWGNDVKRGLMKVYLKYVQVYHYYWLFVCRLLCKYLVVQEICSYKKQSDKKQR